MVLATKDRIPPVLNPRYRGRVLRQMEAGRWYRVKELMAVNALTRGTVHRQLYNGERWGLVEAQGVGVGREFFQDWLDMAMGMKRVKA